VHRHTAAGLLPVHYVAKTPGIGWVGDRDKRGESEGQRSRRSGVANGSKGCLQGGFSSFDGSVLGAGSPGRRKGLPEDKVSLGIARLVSPAGQAV
jgi:hypothetical protein